MGKGLESYAAKEIARHRMQAKEAADLNKAGALRARLPNNFMAAAATEAAMMPHSITVVTQKAVDQNEMLAAWQKAAELDGNPYPEGVTQAVPDGWMAFEMTDGYRLVRGRDGQSLQGSANPMLWAKQILDFEFAEGAEWKPEQIATMNAMQSKDYTPAQVDAFAAALLAPLEPLYGAGTSGGGHSADTGKVVVVGVDMASGPDWTCYRPWLPGASELPVTPEMSDAGFQIGQALQPRSPLLVETLEAIYRGMHAVAPVPLVSEAEDRIAALTKERDADKRLIECDTAAIVAQAEENIRLRALLATKDTEIALLRQALAMKDARIAQLDTRLALIPVAFEDFDDALAKPEHNPFRDFGHDPRRMGP